MNQPQAGGVSPDDILVVIPVYNQPGQLREVVERCLQQHPQVLVVDDGSVPPVAGLLEGLPVSVIVHPRNLGKGAAILTAAAAAIAQGRTHLITLDADGQHFPEDLPKFLAAIREHPGSIVIGVRDFSAPAVPRSSKFGRGFGNFWVWVQTGTRVGDIQSGYRGYPVHLLQRIPASSRRYTFEVEVVVRALWGEVAVWPVPVRVLYTRLARRNSHFHKFHDNLALTLLNTHLTARGLLPWPHLKLMHLAGTEPQVTPMHPWRSLRILLNERATPKELGLASALGIFIGAVPLIGFHTLAILVVAGLFRLNRMAAVAASQLCMPPLVPALCIEAGYFLQHGHFLVYDHATWFLPLGELTDACLQRIWDWLLGSLTFGVLLAAIIGGLSYVIAWLITRRTAETAGSAG